MQSLRKELGARPLLVPLLMQDASDCRLAGVDAKAMLRAGVALDDLFGAGYPTRELKETGATWEQIRDAGCSLCVCASRARQVRIMRALLTSHARLCEQEGPAAGQLRRLGHGAARVGHLGDLNGRQAQ